MGHSRRLEKDGSGWCASEFRRAREGCFETYHSGKENVMSKTPLLTGVIAVPVTPFDPQNRVDLDAFGRLLEHLLARGVHGIAATGTTGEFFALTREERKEIFRFVAEAVRGRAKLLAGTNAMTTAEVIELSAAARDLGYDALLLPPPPVSRPKLGELVAHYEAVDDAVGLPILLYNNPPRSGVELGPDFLAAIRHRPHLFGIKESSGSLDRLHELALHFGNLEISCGSDSQAVEYFLWGATSWTAGPANVLSAELVKVWELCAVQRDFVAGVELMRRLLPLILYMEQSGRFIQCCKYGCELEGVRVGGTRAPLQPLTDDEKACFRRLYEQAKGV
jgi:4-hydroxy-tetrahydrodipicolinate synthase